MWLSFDLDFADLRPPQLWDALTLGLLRSASAVFAVSYFLSGKSCKLMPYDAFHKTREQLSSSEDIIAGSPCGARVVSGFGGVGIYFAQALRRVPGLRYNDSSSGIEHVSFNTRIHDAVGGQHPLYADGRLRPVFLWGDRAWWRHEAESSRATAAVLEMTADGLLAQCRRRGRLPKWLPKWTVSTVAAGLTVPSRKGTSGRSPTSDFDDFDLRLRPPERIWRGRA